MQKEQRLVTSDSRDVLRHFSPSVVSDTGPLRHSVRAEINCRELQHGASARTRLEYKLPLASSIQTRPDCCTFQVPPEGIPANLPDHDEGVSIDQAEFHRTELPYQQD